MRVHFMPELYCLKGWSCGVGSVYMYMFGSKPTVTCSTYPCVDALGYDMETTRNRIANIGAMGAIRKVAFWLCTRNQ